MKNVYVLAMVLATLCATSLRAQQPTMAAPAAPSPVFYLQVPDMGAAWNNAKATALYPICKKLWDAAIADATNQDLADFLSKKGAVEAELGFPLTPDSIYGPIVQAAVITVHPKPAAGDFKMVMALNLADTAKFDQIMELIKKKLQASQSATQPTVAVVEEKIGDATVTVFTSGKGETSYAARHENVWMLSNTRDDIANLLQGNRAVIGIPPNVGASFAKFTKVKPDLQFYADFAQIMGTIQQAAAMAGQNAVPLVPLKGMKDMTAAFQIAQSEIIAEGLVNMDPAAASVFAPAQPGQPLGLAYIPQNTWVARANSNVNALAAYKMLVTQAKTASPEAAAQIEQTIATAEATLGMSLENELLPAFGQNALFAVNDLQINPSFPMSSTADLLLGIEVRDKEKVLKVLQTLEQKVQDLVMQQMGMGASATPGQPQQTPPGMPQLVQITDHNGVQIRTIALSNLIPLVGPNLSPSFALDGNFLLFNLSQASLIKAIDLKAGTGTSLAAHPAVKDLVTRFGFNDASEIVMANVEVMAPLFRLIETQVQSRANPADPDAKLAVDLLRDLSNSLKHWVGASQLNGTEMHGVGLLAMKAPVQP